MVTKTKKCPRKELPYPADGSAEDYVRKFAELMTSPELAAQRVINASEIKTRLGDFIDIPILLGQLRDQATAVNQGDLTNVEAMLTNQAVALQSLFARLTEKGMSAEYLPHFEVFMRMGLRAQSQCRATLETLANIKNPQPMAFVKQANIAHNQQVNNSVTARKNKSRARKNENQQNELLERNDGKRLEPGATGEAVGSDSQMATLGKINRAKNRGR